MPSPRRRDAARVVVLDEDNRILLLRYEEGEGFWAVPGGSLNPGECHAAAARRELEEELGAEDVQIGPELAVRTKDHQVGNETARQVEKYFVAVLVQEAVDPARATQPDDIRGWQWWSLSDLRETAETVYPLGLADLISDYLKYGAPATPVVLRG